ncbi:hypothetical protein WQE_34651 [Paraburkholderia hospita]|uniref:Uncharacterized protein n=1 Tax=Paraburkholderia hospita TaxID=169430 RepID=A0ABP2PFW1_9BURK|nr:hypothetical protein [Paraburkholderia hospita]EIM96274.1 hypothetical protein WQE_34651 [Paraburkholderia hospita]OUL80002.1 hypothetical protein CA602_28395 [Paraburkholderia hospita]
MFTTHLARQYLPGCNEEQISFLDRIAKQDTIESYLAFDTDEEFETTLVLLGDGPIAIEWMQTAAVSRGLTAVKSLTPSVCGT